MLQTSLPRLVFLVFAGFISSSVAAAELEILNPDALNEALQKLQSNTTLKIASGDFPGGFYVTKVDNLTIEAMDPSNPPHFKGGTNAWQFSKCNNLVLRNLKISGQTHNGINVDDGGSPTSPTKNILLENLFIHDIGPQGNHDGIKCSGIDQLTIRHCRIQGWGGQAIDLVGCHDVKISDCHLIGEPAFEGTAGVQTKGGSSNVHIANCQFVNAGMRPLNIGGSTGLPYFRPEGAKYEAKNITVKGSVISGSPCAAAFVGVDGAEFSNNVILYPEKWVFRVLQETQLADFAPCQNVVIKNNIIFFRATQVNRVVNVGDGTKIETFRIESNTWIAEDLKQNFVPNIPSINPPKSKP